jgi:predicted signal transduction protein with EAL and GGDEF domain
VQSALRVIGHDVRLAVDDAGAGIANFAHIIELQPNLVKLDIGLVRGVNTDRGRQALVVGMRHFAAEAGCRLLAEGVGTEAEAETLLALGVDLGQGYVFGHPEPAETWVARAAALVAARARGDAAGARTEAAVARALAAAGLEPPRRARTRATGRRERIPRAGKGTAERDVVADARDEIERR